MTPPAPLLVGVGVGPGDPDLVTVKGVRVLRDADLVLVPVMDLAEPGRAEATVRAHIAHDRVRRVVFALGEGHDEPRRESAWDAATQAVLDAFAGGAAVVAFATIGDPNVYSTFSYLSQAVRERLPQVEVQTVPGITAMQDLAARSGTVLCEGTQTLALFPMTAGLSRFRQALEVFDTVVAYKGGRHLAQVARAVRDAGRDGTAVFGASLGLPGERVAAFGELTDAASDADMPYLSTVLVPPARSRRGSQL